MGNPVYRRYTVAGTVVGPQAPINMDWLPLGQATLAVWLAGAGAYSVEGTLDDVISPEDGGRVGSAVPPRWFTLTEFPVASAVAKYAAIRNPWLWVRINIESIGADIEFKVQQAVTTFRG